MTEPQSVKQVDTHRYFRVSPRGFANEVFYVHVSNAVEAEIVERHYEHLEDNTPGASAGWSRDRRASIPGVAVPFLAWRDEMCVFD